MAFRMADPAGSRRLAGSTPGLYQGPRRRLPGSVNAESLEISCRSSAFGALLSSLSLARRGLLPSGALCAGRRQYAATRSSTSSAAHRRDTPRRPTNSRSRIAAPAASDDAQARRDQAAARGACARAACQRASPSGRACRRSTPGSSRSGLPPAGGPPEPDIVAAERQAYRREGRDQCGARRGRDRFRSASTAWSRRSARCAATCSPTC